MKITDSKYLFTSGKCILCVVLLLFLVAGGCNEPAEPDHIYLVSLQTTAKTPSSPLLFSHFVEIGFGYQIQPMMAEKFFNRSFEPIPPYNGKTKNSFGLLLPEGRYIDNWSGEAWYHSGYAMTTGTLPLVNPEIRQLSVMTSPISLLSLPTLTSKWSCATRTASMANSMYA
jgi:hypothetical protein